METRTISKGMLILMLMVSVLVDIGQLLLDLIPGIGWAINIAVDLCVGWVYFLWFKICGVKFKKGPLISFAAGAILDMIPYVSAFAWTLDVLMVYATAKTAPKQG